MRAELNRLAGELRGRLPEHTYKAVIRRAKRQRSDEGRRSLLNAVLADRKRSEGAS